MLHQPPPPTLEVRRSIGARRAIGATVAATLLALSPSALAGQSVGPVTVPDHAASRRSEPPPLHLAQASRVLPLAVLRPASEGAVDQLEALRAWNDAGHLPARNGFVRPLPLPADVRFWPDVESRAFGPLGGGVFQVDGGRVVWGAEVRVDQAARVRLHLDRVDLPPGTRMWVYGEDGESIGPFGLELVHEGGLWTPSVAGAALRIEVELPASGLGASTRGFAVDRVAEIVLEDAIGPRGAVLGPRAGECLEDVTCFGSSHFPGVAAAIKAVAQLSFIDDFSSSVCSGTLLNDADTTTFVPYLLTANHCIDNQGAASSLESTFDYKTTSCEGSTPPVSSLPQINGSTLLATGSVASGSTDFTLLRLSSLPAGRTLMGWNVAAIDTSTRLSSISHPVPNSAIFPQSLAQGHKVASPNNCGLNQTKFIPMVNDIRGGTFGGSSGSALMLDSGQVVGQLLGGCGPNPSDGCDQDNDDVWGAFSATFPSVSQYLNVPANGNPPPPGSTWLTTSALPGYDFQIRISGTSTGVKESDCVPETLCISGAVPGRSEIFVRIVGPKPNGYLHVNIIKFTTSRIEVWVRRGGQINYYDLPAVASDSNSLAGLVDKTAFLP